MNKQIAILLPYKEQYTRDHAGAASIWVKDYIKKSKFKDITLIYGNLDKKYKPFTKNFKSLDLGRVIKKNISYTENLYKEYQKYKFKIIEIHNRPESLVHLLKKKIKTKFIFIFHNNPLDLRGSSSINERIFIAENTDQIYFVSKWVKNKFFEGLPYKYRNNCDILYPAIQPLNKFPKKENIIIFSGKLNSSKGYDVFGNAVIKILDKYKNWKALAIGNEPREKHNFFHKRFKILDWIKHDEILKYYKKSSISIVPSKWQEPFGRTALESAAYGCSTITSKNGGLPETFKNPIFLNKVNKENLFNEIKKLIDNPQLMQKIQKNNFKSVIHTIQKKVIKIDSWKGQNLDFKLNIKKNKSLKILHVSTFDEKNDHRLFNISIANKISKGLIRNNHDVINFNYRAYIKKNLISEKNSLINNKIINICNNYRPDLIILGHNNVLDTNSIESIKTKYKSKIILWYEDALGHRGKGPNWRENLSLIEKNNLLIDNYFLTTHPSEISTSINRKKMFFLPIPVDENIENLELYKNNYKYKDLFFAFSHGVNFGKLKRGKSDERETFINDLMNSFPKINYNILGVSNHEPKWNYEFYRELSKCKIALNLSRGMPLRYTSSNRIASLIGNGIYTFIDQKTKFSDFFDENEMGFYKNINDLGKKIEILLSNPKKLQKFGRLGKKRYFELFNNKKIAKEIIDFTF
tara:strand:- start:1681 stop:3759 length:2079 start_codon:yes stop_codon:yes gene_type:complete